MKFHLELDEKERDLLLYALGAIYQIPESSRLAQRVAALRSPIAAPAAKPSPSVGIPAAVDASRVPAPVSPPEPPAPARTNDDSLGELVITPTKVDQPSDGKSMVVHYRIRNGASVRVTRMQCWDPKQFGTILETVGKSTTFITKKTKTGFVNIVGVKR